jgi:hypothetical protein
MPIAGRLPTIELYAVRPSANVQRVNVRLVLPSGVFIRLK